MTPRRRTDLATLAVVLVALAFYGWTAWTSTGFDFGFGDQIGPYNLQAQGFQDGRLSLPVEVPPALLVLDNPYDPAKHFDAREGRFHDFALYDGKFQSAWGPAPVITLFLPIRLVGLGDISERDATLVFSVLALLALVALLRLLVRRLVPRTPGWMEVLGVAVLAFCNIAPHLLRKPLVYEVASSAGLAFFALGLLMLGGALLGERRPLLRLGLGSLFIGLAAASRPTFLFAGIFVAVALLLVARGDVLPAADRRRAVVALVVPAAGCLLLLGLFNTLRFDSPLQFGQRWQLGAHEQTQLPLYTLDWVGPGLWFYLGAPVRWSVQFPFFWPPPPPGYPFGAPPDYYAVERTSGVFTTIPLTLMLFAAPFALRRASKLVRASVAGLAAFGLFVAVFLAGAVYTTTMRYEADFIAPLLLATLLCWYAWHARLKGRARKALGVVGATLATYGIVVAAASSVIGVDNTLPNAHPEMYSKLERFFSPLPTIATQIAGGPIVAALDHSGTSGVERYDQIGADGGSREAGTGAVTVQVVAPRTELAQFSVLVVPGPAVPQGGSVMAEIGGRGSGLAPVSVPANGKPQLVPVHLRRGLNELTVAVRPASGTTLLPRGARGLVADVRFVEG